MPRAIYLRKLRKHRSPGPRVYRFRGHVQIGIVIGAVIFPAIH